VNLVLPCRLYQPFLRLVEATRDVLNRRYPNVVFLAWELYGAEGAAAALSRPAIATGRAHAGTGHLLDQNGERASDSWGVFPMHERRAEAHPVFNGMANQAARESRLGTRPSAVKGRRKRCD
jgi:hypothetical protein